MKVTLYIVQNFIHKEQDLHALILGLRVRQISLMVMTMIILYNTIQPAFGGYQSTLQMLAKSA